MALTLPLTESDLATINSTLSKLPPQEILAWAIEHLPNLYQSTAFGLTGLVTIDMLSQLSQSPPALIFIDTLYHFNETLDLVERVKRRYGVPIHVYRPKDCGTTQEFERKHGQFLWIGDEDQYDYLVKVGSVPRSILIVDIQPL
jgi:phosphoadenosine phosphosulfate reductase